MNASRPTSWKYAYSIIVVIIKINLLSVPPNHILRAKCITQTEALSEIKVSLLIQEICQHLATEAATLTFVMLSLKKKQASYSIKCTRLHREETLPLSASVTIWITYEQWSSAEQIFNFLSYLFTQLCNRYSCHSDKDNRSDLCIPALLPKNWDLQEMWMHKLPLWKKRCFIIYDFILTDGNHKYASSTSCQSC